MSARSTFVHLATRAAIMFGALFLVSVLLAAIPTGKTVVSESGIRTRHEIEELERVGVDAVLIGETLMRAPDPEQAVRDLTGPEDQE